MFGPLHNEMQWAKVRKEQISSGQNSVNDGKVYRRRRRGSSVVDIIKKARGGSDNTSDIQANKGSVVKMSARGSSESKDNTEHPPDNRSDQKCQLLPDARRKFSRRKSSMRMTNKQFRSLKTLVNFVQKHDIHSLKLLQIAMTPFKVCSR